MLASVIEDVSKYQHVFSFKIYSETDDQWHEGVFIKSTSSRLLKSINAVLDKLSFISTY